MVDKGDLPSELSDKQVMHLLLQNLAIPALIVNDELIVIYCNDQAVELLGIKRSRIEDKPIQALYPKESEIVSSVKKALQEKSSFDVMDIVGERTLRARLTSTSFGILVMIEDATLQTMIEKALGRKIELDIVVSKISSRLVWSHGLDEALTQTLFDIGMLANADKSRLFLINQSGESVLCRTQWTKTDSGITPESQVSFDLENIRWLFTQFEERGILRFLDKDKLPKETKKRNNWLYLAGVKSAVLLPVHVGPSIRGFISLEKLHDPLVWNEEEESHFKVITEVLSATLTRVEIQETLRMSEERYRQLIDKSLQGIIIIRGPPFRITFSNPVVQTILGYSFPEFDALSVPSFEAVIHWTDRSKLLDVLNKLMAQEITNERVTSRFIHKNESIIWLDISLAFIQHEGADAILATFIDVTETRQALADLLDSTRDLELYTSLLRHDIKNDLQAIISNNEAIEMLVSDNEVLDEFTGATSAAVDRMIHVLNIFGKHSVETDRLVAPFLERITVEAARSYVGIKPTLRIEPSILLTRIVGGRLLPMVFHNIFRNAAKYAGPNPTVSLVASRSEGFVVIRIADNGPGISEEVKDDLFQKGVTTEGSGLGLYLSRKVLKAYNGSIELLEPEEGEGAVFLVKLEIASG